MAAPRSKPTVEAGQIHQEIDQSLREIEQLAAGGGEPGEFYAGLLERTVRVASATGAAVWMAGAGGALHLLREHRLNEVLHGEKRSAIDRERQRLAVWLANSEDAANGPGTDLHVSAATLVSPLRPADNLWGLLTVYLPAKVDPAALVGLRRYIDAAAALATDFQAHTELRHWNQDRDGLSRLHELAVEIHRPWSARDVFAGVANEGRRFLGCDRVALAVRRGGRLRVVAASGTAELARRSRHLQRLEALATAAMRPGQPFFYSESPQTRPPQIERPLQHYLDESGTRRLAILPLEEPRDSGEESRRRSGPVAAAIIVEQMSDRPLDESWQALWLLADHAAIAVHRATRLRRLPVVGALLGVASLRRTMTRRWLPRTALVAATLTAAAAAMLLIETEHHVRVTGEFYPTNTRQVFAPSDGVVVQLRAAHGDRVSEGQWLATLKSPEFERETTRLRGAIATAEKRLAAANAERLQPLGVEAANRRSPSQLATNILVIEQELATLREELALLDQEAEKLRVTSPIAGEVVSWDLDQSLGSRPVQRGQRLMTVADLASTWRLRLRAPDAQAGPILAAHRASPEGVPVRFVTAAEPEQPHNATATVFRLACEADPVTGENHLVFEADLPAGLALQPRPGAEVVGQVACGRRSLAYVWLSDLYHELRRRFF